MDAPVPVIDFANFSQVEAADDVTGLQRLANQIGEALKQYGAFYLDNTDFPETVITELWESGDLFFDQPLEAKERYLMASPPDKGGYVGHGQDKGYLRDANSNKIMPVDHESLLLYPLMSNFTNPPDEAAGGLMPRFRRFFDEAAALCALVLRCIALDLGKDKHFFETNISRNLTLRKDGNSSAGRINYYAPCTAESEKEEERFAAHKDYECITLAWQDQNGLQGEVEGQWRDIPPRKGSLLVLAGTAMETLSANRYQALMHRVVPGSRYQGDRRSTIFFYTPDEDCLIAPINGDVTSGKTFKQHVIDVFEWFTSDKQGK